MAKLETKFSKADKAYKQVLRIREKCENDVLLAPGKIREKASELRRARGARRRDARAGRGTALNIGSRWSCEGQRLREQWENERVCLTIT